MDSPRLPDFTPLASPRLVIRPVQLADLPDLLEINGDPEVTRFLPYATWQQLADGEAWLKRMEAMVATGNAHQLVMQRRADGKVIGTVLVFRFDAGSARAELGYVVGRAHWRQGYAHEALATTVGALFGSLGLRRLEAEVDPANVASNGLLRALGFTLEGRLRQRWVGRDGPYDIHVYGRLAGDPAPRGEAAAP